MEIIPSEYFLGDSFELEPGRFQSFRNCWANAIASLIGDTFCLQNNLKPIIPSTIWITSMKKDACEYYNLGNCDNPTLISGFRTELMVKYMKDKSDKYFVKLEKCFPELDTVQFISDQLEIDYESESEEEDDRLWQVKLQYLGNSYSNCCIKEEIISGKRKPVDCLIPKNEKENLEMKFYLKIENFYKIDYDFIDKKYYTSEKIQNLQNLIKNIIYCQKKPILTSILCTDSRSLNLRNLKLNNYYYKLKTKVLSIDELNFSGSEKYTKHAIVIYGWKKNKENNQEYWIVRDSMIHSFEHEFYYIPFSTIYNIDYWIGCDIDWIETYRDKSGKLNTKRRINNSLSFIDVTVDPEMLKAMLVNNIFQKNEY